MLPHLSISGTARSILDGDHGAEEEEDDRQVGETLLGETSEGCDDDPDVGAWREEHCGNIFWRKKTDQGRQGGCHSDQQNARLPLPPKTGYCVK